MVTGRRPSREAKEKHAADVQLAAQFPDLFRAARDAEDALRRRRRAARRWPSFARLGWPWTTR